MALNIFTRVSLTSGVEPRAAEEPQGSMTRGVALQWGEEGRGGTRWVYSSWQMMMMAEKFTLARGETSRQLENRKKKERKKNPSSEIKKKTKKKKQRRAHLELY